MAEPGLPLRLEQLLAFPQSRGGRVDIDLRLERWDRIKNGHKLFDTLVEIVRECHVKPGGDVARTANASLVRSLASLEEWRTFTGPGKDDRTLLAEQSEKARTLVGAALVAAQLIHDGTPIARDRLDGVALHNLDAAFGGRDWAELALLSLLEDAGVIPVTRSTAVVRVAIVRGAAGDLAWLAMEIIEGGRGRLAHHPRHAFCTDAAHDTFGSGMNLAWNWNRGRSDCDGRWHLLEADSKRPALSSPCLKSISGASASGAAAYGWELLLASQHPDPYVVVMAEVVEGKESENGCRLSPVRDIALKVSAVIDVPGIDTIVVTDSDVDEAIAQANAMSVPWTLKTPDGQPYQRHADGICCIALSQL